MAQIVLSGAAEASKYLPALWSKAKQVAPTAIAKASALLGTPQAPAQSVITEAAKRGNGVVTSNILQTLARSGVQPDLMKVTVPTLTESDLQVLRSQYAELVITQRAAVNAMVPNAPGPLGDTRTLNMIRTVNAKLQFANVDQLTEFIEALHLLDAEGISSAYARNIVEATDPRATARGYGVPPIQG